MRFRTALIVFVALNAAWAALFLSQARRPVQQIVLDAPGASPQPSAKPAASSNGLPAAAPAPGATNAPRGTNTPAPAASTNAIASAPGRQFGWKEVQTDDYQRYLTNLRAAGCPETQIRRIILQDVNDLFDQRRLQEAVAKDPQWWQPNAFYLGGFARVTTESNLDEERRTLLEKLLGPKWGDLTKGAELTSSTVPNLALTGPVLGAMPAETYNTVQEVCNRAADRYSAYVSSRFADGKVTDSIEMAKLRNQTRVDLSKTMSPAELEEFLLRNSHNAQNLRLEVAGFNPTPEEFRKMFRAVDPIDHQLQVEFGGPEALSPKQREQYQRQRELAIKEALPPERFAAFMSTRDPVFRLAYQQGLQLGLNTNSVTRLLAFYKGAQQQLLAIQQNPALTPQQKAVQAQAIELQKQQIPFQLLQEQARAPR